MDIAIKIADKKTRRDPGALYAKALDRHNQIERELARVMNRWQKSRALLKRVEKKLDELQSAAWEA
jgi:predicted  nucleic acid-binding Zn-ribbon protein